MPRVAIIGSGLIGRAWAMVFARAGWDVAMYDAVAGAAEKALALVGEGLDELARHGLVDDPKGAAARVRAAKSVADALDGIFDAFRINWVWLPPWGPEHITEDGREQLRALGFNL